jgi:signal transduction histidine kinase
VTNVVQFPVAPASGRHTGSDFFDTPPAQAHAVQFYEDEGYLCEVVARFASAGLAAGENVALITTKAHKRGILQRIERGVLDDALAAGRLTIFDARHLLTEFMCDGMPDHARFGAVFTRLLSGFRRQGAPLRVFGEMVDLLWRENNAAAALELEALWCKEEHRLPLRLLCAYGLQRFAQASDTERFVELCGYHSHVLPAESFAHLSDAASREREVSLLQQRAQALAGEVSHRKLLESELGAALLEQGRTQMELRASLMREHEARAQELTPDGFRELFVGVLGQSLREPLHDVLTTGRLMTLRRDLSADGERRLQRLLACAAKLQRMLEQSLDLAREGLPAGGFLVHGHTQDLRPLVLRVVQEAWLAEPSRSIDVSALESCSAPVDEDRFLQLVATLLGNALTHGDPNRPIGVELAASASLVTLRVSNFGPPIDPAALPSLFDPPRRIPGAESRSEGLGLGLFIAQRIARGHGGHIEVESSEGAGTRFTATFAR